MRRRYRTVRGFVPYGGRTAALLSCGHHVVTSATHVRRMRCPHCEREAGQREHEWIHTSDSSFARQHRRVLAARAELRAAELSESRPKSPQAPPTAGPQSQEGA